MMTLLEVLEDPPSVAKVLPQIIALSNRDKEALGFLPNSAFEDACLQGRIIVARENAEGASNVAGYVLFGGVFPHARVYQISVNNDSRRSGIASRMMQALVARLEAEGYLSLSAKVADDLPIAASFYKRNGFQATKSVVGGSSRSRQITIFARSLNTDDLFSITRRSEQPDLLVSLALRSTRSGDAPFYVFDLNVLFDLIRNRKRTASARRLFGAALAHKVRLVVTPEFLTELRRTSFDAADDVVLKMALQLPQLTQADDGELATLAATVHRIVFEDTHSPQAGSA